MPWRENRIVTVEHGQSLSAIALAYHVPERAIIAANQLKPPYELRAGARLVIPAAGGQAPAPAVASTAPASMPSASPTPLTQTGYGQTPAAAVPQTAAGGPPQPAALTPPSSAMTGAEASVIPLDGPAPPRQAIAAGSPAVASTAPGAAPAAPAVLAARNADAALPLPGEAPAAVPPGAAAPSDASASGRFPWPVSGKILAGYGAATDGARNEGINIAAPRGTAVRAIDGGTVAYVGNEVKGYGNLVLVKHANGWISAYAHLGDVTVKEGDRVSPGQLIARVGDTGGVAEPQLHFELRRGKKPVDPREFLAPAPSAGGVVAGPAG